MYVLLALVFLLDFSSLQMFTARLATNQPFTATRGYELRRIDSLSCEACFQLSPDLSMSFSRDAIFSHAHLQLWLSTFSTKNLPFQPSFVFLRLYVSHHEHGCNDGFIQVMLYSSRNEFLNFVVQLYCARKQVYPSVRLLIIIPDYSIPFQSN